MCIVTTTLPIRNCRADWLKISRGRRAKRVLQCKIHLFLFASILGIFSSFWYVQRVRSTAWPQYERFVYIIATRTYLAHCVIRWVSLSHMHPFISMHSPSAHSPIHFGASKTICQRRCNCLLVSPFSMHLS